MLNHLFLLTHRGRQKESGNYFFQLCGETASPRGLVPRSRQLFRGGGQLSVALQKSLEAVAVFSSVAVHSETPVSGHDDKTTCFIPHPLRMHAMSPRQRET